MKIAKVRRKKTLALDEVSENETKKKVGDSASDAASVTALALPHEVREDSLVILRGMAL